MTALTITEGLAEIKTIQKRLAKKQEFIKAFLFRQDQMKDPLDKDGGSFQAIKRERQSIADLHTRLISIRTAILKANMETTITVGKQARTIEEWLIWRRDVAPALKQLLGDMHGSLKQMRQQVMQKGLQVVTGGAAATNPTDVVVNVNEQELSEEIEDAETVLGTLDGQLSLKNATVLIEV